MMMLSDLFSTINFVLNLSVPVTQRRVMTAACPSRSGHKAHLIFADIQEPTG